MNKMDDRVAIIGGGLSGLVIAEGLYEKGYKNITVFEKEEHVGGKLHTICYKGKSYEFGALFGLPSQNHLKKMMKKYNVKIDGPKLSRVNYDTCGNKIMQIPKEFLDDFIEEVERLPDVLATYKSLDHINIYNLEPSMMLPFSQWCDLNGFVLLKIVYAHHFTSYGLGDTGVVPALYVLRTLTYDNLMSFLELPEFCTWKEGVSMLIECLNREMKDIRMAQQVIKISLSSNDQVCVHTDFEVLKFDRVIIATPLEQFADFYDADYEMKRFLLSIKYQAFNVYAFIANSIPKGCGFILENLSVDRVGHILIWNTRWDSLGEEAMVMVYAYNNPANSKAESLKTIESDLIKLGIQSPRLYQYKNWRQCPYVETEDLQKGFYEKMEAMQGKYNVFLAGEIMSMVTMDNCIQYSNYLVHKYF